MNDLPKSGLTTGNNQIDQPDPRTDTPSGVTGGVNKEKESLGLDLKEEALHDVSGQEIELPKEVVAAGVKVAPTTVTIPATVAQMGVMPVGQNIPPASTPTVALPLTDDQIAQGLQQSVTNSIRWLSQWCVRRLKQLHLALKYIHGKVMRVNTP